MNNDLPGNASISDDTTVVPDDSGQVHPPASYAPTPEQGGFAPVPEQIETISPEVITSPEVPVAPPEPETKDEVEEVTPAVVATPDAPVPNVVDKRSHKVADVTPLRTTQKLTAEADVEEADFIEHVEEMHPTN